MAGLPLKVTTAGRAALVNAANSGTLPVTIVQIGVTATGFTPATDGSNTTLPGELKRLSTVAGGAVADDTLHLTIRDDSADAYSLPGFALYLAAGTLFALYGQTSEIMGKSAQSTLLLATDTVFADIAATSITMGSTDFWNPPATESVQGVVELATDAEANTGTDAVRAVTPKGMRYTLDQRLGAGAPSTFIRTLLALTTAAALRMALAIKSAALKDEGAGNGLDADTVDGKHASDFATSGHQHSWGEISGVVPTWNQSTSGNAATATKLATARTLTIGGTGKSFDGAANVGWTLGEIGAAAVSHSHDAAHVVTGVFDPARIPEIAISKVTNLAQALNTKADLAGATFEGTVRVPILLTDSFISVGDDSSFVDINVANTVGLFGGQFAGVAYIQFGNGAQCKVGFDGSKLVLNGYEIWHAGNFDQATKANLSGANFTGAITAPNMTSVGRVFSNAGYFSSTSNVAVLSSAENGTVYLRPNGADSSAGQTIINPTGDILTSGDVSVSGDWNFGIGKSGFDLSLKGWSGINFHRKSDNGIFTVWHAANFDPNSRVNKGGDQMSGTLVSGASTGELRVGGQWKDAESLVIRYDGAMAIAKSGIAGTFQTIWNSGNFDPNSKANLSGANFTGAITAPTLQATSSDARLKDDIADLRGCLEKILKLRPRSWRWKESGESDFGFIAQEHREVLPEAVHQAEPVESESEGMMFIRYGKAEALIVGALHEIAARLSALEDRVR